MHRLQNFLTHGASLRALRAPESSAIKTGIRCIMRLDELSFEMRLERHTTKGSSSGRIMRLVPAFIQEAHNQTNYYNASFVTVLLVQYSNSKSEGKRETVGVSGELELSE